MSQNVINEMSKRGMKVAGKKLITVISIVNIPDANTGFSTNGKWNSLRSKGAGRPITVFEIRSQVRQKYSD